MVRKLHRDSEAVRRGRSVILWCTIEMIGRRPADVGVLAYAAARGWIEVSSPDADRVRVTEAGQRVINDKRVRRALQLETSRPARGVGRCARAGGRHVRALPIPATA